MSSPTDIRRVDLVQGPPGVRGVDGVQGTQGVQGAVGALGPQGAQGVQGVVGAQGVQGVVGAQGVAGVQGSRGFGLPNDATISYAAVADGVTSNHTVLPGVVAGGLSVYFPPGVYRFTSSCTLDYTCVFAVGASFSAPDGVTVTIGGIDASSTQAIFSTTGTFKLSGVHEIYPEWWGAKVLTPGQAITAGFECYPAIQACFNSAASPTGLPHIIRFRAGTYRCNKPVIVIIQGTHWEGSGINATSILSDNQRMPSFVLQALQGNLPTVTAPFGGPGRAWDMGFRQGYNDGAGYLIATNQFNCLLPGMECSSLFGHFFEFWTQTEISGFYKVPLGSTVTVNTVTVGSSYSLTLGGATFAYTAVTGDSLYTTAQALVQAVNRAMPTGVQSIMTDGGVISITYANAAVSLVNNSGALMTIATGLPIVNSTIFAIADKLGPSDAGQNTIYVGLSANGKLNAQVVTRGTGAAVFSGDHPTVLTPGKWYYWTLNWSGTTSKFFVGLAGTDNPSSLTTTSTSLTQGGSLDFKRWSNVSIGGFQPSIPASGSSLVPSFGYLYNLQIKNVATRTTDFIPPTTAETSGGSTQWLTNFEAHGPNGECVGSYVGITATVNTYTPIRQGNHGYYAYFNGGMVAKDFTTNGGIYVNDCLHGDYANIAINGGGYGLVLNNSYSGKMDSIVVNNTLNGIIVSNGGLNLVANCQANNSVNFGFYFKDAAVELTNAFILASKIGLLAVSNGSQSVINVRGGSYTTEGVNDYYSAVYVDGNQTMVNLSSFTLDVYGDLFDGTYAGGRGGVGYTLAYRGVYDIAATYVASDTVRLSAADPYLYRALGTVSGIDPDSGNALWSAKIRRDAIYIASPQVKLVADGCSWVNTDNLGCRVRFAPACDFSSIAEIRRAGLDGATNVPWTNRPELFPSSPDGRAVNSRGISSSPVEVKNHTGAVFIANTSTSSVVTLPVTEVDSNYVVGLLGVTAKAGSPVISQPSVALGQTTTGFTVNLGSAPGAGSAVAVGWMLTRAVPGPQPAVTGIAPTHGAASGGTSVTLTGTSFLPAAIVTFAGTPATAVSVASPTSLTCVTPAGTAASNPAIQVTNPDGSFPSRIYRGYAYDAAIVAGSPASLASAIASLRADAGVSLSGSNVVSWSGYGAAISAPAANGPTVKTGSAGINGQTTISFDGISQFLRGALALSGAGSVYAVFKYTAFPSAVWNMYDGTAGGGYSGQAGGAWLDPYGKIGYSAAFQATTTSPGVNVAIAAVARLDSTGARLDFNATMGTLAGAAHTFSANSLILGAAGNGSANVGFGQVDVAEICVYSAFLTTAEITTLDTYTFNRYAVHV